jgi:hypothetical protein
VVFNVFYRRISHAISHHTYPNTETDFEASTIEPFINFMTNKPRNSRLVFVYMHPFMALASTIDFFSRSVLILRGRFPLSVNHFFPILVWLPAVAANGMVQGTLLTLAMQVVFTPLFNAALITQCIHSWRRAQQATCFWLSGAAVVCTVPTHAQHCCINDLMCVLFPPNHFASSFLVHRTKFSWTAGDASFGDMQSFGARVKAALPSSLP